jgi:hypothetical protein
MHFRRFVSSYPFIPPFQGIKKRLYWVNSHDTKQTYYDLIKYTYTYETYEKEKEKEIDKIVIDIEHIKKDLNKILQFLHTKRK